ncbi:hypothetical protein OBBRIDRAFT_530981, partial [Obba rivulosa]
MDEIKWQRDLHVLGTSAFHGALVTSPLGFAPSTWLYITSYLASMPLDYICTVPNCDRSFGALWALTKHQRTFHLHRAPDVHNYHLSTLLQLQHNEHEPTPEDEELEPIPEEHGCADAQMDDDIDDPHALDHEYNDVGDQGMIESGLPGSEMEDVQSETSTEDNMHGSEDIPNDPCAADIHYPADAYPDVLGEDGMEGDREPRAEGETVGRKVGADELMFTERHDKLN